MFTRSTTNSVQSFIRGLSWLVTFALLNLLITVPINASYYAATGESSWLTWPLIFIFFFAANIVSKMFYILPEWERIVLLRLGKFLDVRGPGFFIIPPFIYSVAEIVDIRIETYQVEATATLTKDNVPTKVTAALEFRVENPQKAIIQVQNYRQTITWVATEALKNTIGSLELKDLLSERDTIASNLRHQIDITVEQYGVDVRAVRITDIDTPPSLVEELAVIARERRAAEAKQIAANAEVLVATKIAEASRELQEQGAGGLRLRELQLLSEMSKNEGTMVIVYPYGDRSGSEIANGAASQMLNQVYREPEPKKSLPK
jgi:regulator of protease activity HflC (stomatin/prohibitin superfamily)